MNILFPSNPLNPKGVDEAFGAEVSAAKEAGFGISRVDLEIILGGDVNLRAIPEAPAEFEGRGDILYRGWLMKPEHYLAIDLRLGRRLVTGPAAYEIAYNLPQWYPLFAEDATPRTLVLPGQTFDLDDVATKVEQEFQTGLNKTDQGRKRRFWEWKMSMGFNTAHEPVELMELPGPRPVMIKDYLKSAKHRWFDACYIPDCQDAENVKRVTGNFLATQGEHLTGGLCFRRFIECKQIGIHSKTQQPLVNEWRAFLKHGRVFYLCPYWSEGDYSKGATPNASDVEALCVGLKDLPFVAVDFGEMEKAPIKEFDNVANQWTYGSPWVVFEVNDGGGAGVPDGGNIIEFYQALKREYAP